MQLQSVDSTVYSSSIFSETLVHRNGSVGRPKLVINLTQIDYLHSLAFVYMDKNMPPRVMFFKNYAIGGG